MLIAIPSMGRADKQLTLKNLRKTRCHDNTVVCVPAREAARYRQFVMTTEVVEVPDEIRGISDTRQWILNDLSRQRRERYVLMLDDDMDFCYRPVVTEPKLLMVETEERMRDMLGRLEKWLSDGFVHVGISARQGNNNESYGIGGIYGLHPHRDATRMMNAYAYDCDVLRKLRVDVGRNKVMHDFDLTLQLLRMGYPNRVLFEYCWNQRGSNSAGGCSTYRTAQVQETSARQLAADHPGFVRLVVKQNKETSGAWKGMKERVDVVVDWRKAYASSGKELVE